MATRCPSCFDAIDKAEQAELSRTMRRLVEEAAVALRSARAVLVSAVCSLFNLTWLSLLTDLVEDPRSLWKDSAMPEVRSLVL